MIYHWSSCIVVQYDMIINVSSYRMKYEQDHYVRVYGVLSDPEQW